MEVIVYRRATRADKFLRPGNEFVPAKKKLPSGGFFILRGYYKFLIISFASFFLLDFGDWAGYPRAMTAINSQSSPTLSSLLTSDLRFKISPSHTVPMPRE